MVILDIKEANPWWVNKTNIENDFHLSELESQKIRWNYEIIEKFEPGIYSLRGPRQVGKTTWIKQRIKKLLENNDAKNIFFYSCDNIKDFKELIELIDLFLDIADCNKNNFIFLDEIPYVEEWQKGIKHLYDSGKLKKSTVILTGSHSIDIKRSIEKLPGRGDSGKRHYIMLPLTFSQYLNAIGKGIELFKNIKKNISLLKINLKEIDKEYKNYLKTGGFLRIINEFHSTGKINDTSYDIYSKWIIGDLAKWDLKEYYAKQILKRIAECYSTESSWASIRSGTDIDSPHTSAKYINAIEEMFVVNFIFKMDFNKKEPDYPKSKKIYFSDPFIFASCFKWINGNENNFEKYSQFIDANIDKISEGVLLNHLISFVYRDIKSNIYDYKNLIYYWTNQNKTKEIDFVYKNISFELKFKDNIKAKDYRGLDEFKKGFMITKNSFDERTFPISAFLLLFEKHWKEIV